MFIKSTVYPFNSVQSLLTIFRLYAIWAFMALANLDLSMFFSDFAGCIQYDWCIRRTIKSRFVLTVFIGY